ncbi:peptidylprolyl isomerase [Carnobacteriaceae bacterium zg-ZUI240]|nr:peptidylprolyl isomerase [Carnobacteriaceae bacterium zg-ZUI240]
MKTKKLATLVATGAMVLLAGCSNTNSNVATSKYGNVTKDEMYTLMQRTHGAQALYSLLVEKTAAAKVKDKSGIDQFVTEFIATREQSAGGKEAFEKLVKESGFSSVEDFKKAIYNSRVTLQVIKENIAITDEEITAAYETYTPKIQASHILVPDNETALNIIKELQNGGDWNALAAKHSTDASNKDKGGSLGEFDPSTMVKEFAEAAKAMKNGEISTTPVKTTFGYHVIKMEKNNPKGSLEDEKANIKESLLNAKASNSAEQQKVMTNLLKDADVKISDEFLSKSLSSILSPESALPKQQ